MRIGQRELTLAKTERKRVVLKSGVGFRRCVRYLLPYLFVAAANANANAGGGALSRYLHSFGTDLHQHAISPLDILRSIPLYLSFPFIFYIALFHTLSRTLDQLPYLRAARWRYALALNPTPYVAA